MLGWNMRIFKFAIFVHLTGLRVMCCWCGYSSGKFKFVVSSCR